VNKKKLKYFRYLSTRHCLDENTLIENFTIYSIDEAKFMISKLFKTLFNVDHDLALTFNMMKVSGMFNLLGVNNC